MDRLLFPRRFLAIATLSLLASACTPFRVYDVKLRTLNVLQHFDAATMTALELETQRLGLVLYPRNERNSVDGKIVSLLVTPTYDSDPLHVRLYWLPDPEPGTSGFEIIVSGDGRGHRKIPTARIDDVADHLQRVLRGRFGGAKISVERGERDMWIF